jgi:hypothetical protein
VVGKEVGTQCLVGKLRTKRIANKEAFKRVLSRIWCLVG